MSLSLKDIERGVGADLLRRPVATSTINAFILRFYHQNILEWPEDVEQEPVSPGPKTIQNEIDDEDPLQKYYAQQSTSHKYMSVTDAEEAQRRAAQQAMIENVAAAFLFIFTHLLVIVGVAETIVWIVFAILFKLIGLPRVYAFEKLLLDVRAIVAPQSLRYVDRNIRLTRDDSRDLPRLQCVRRGPSLMSICVISPTETITRDTASMLRIFRYNTSIAVCYFTDDALVLAGRNKDVIESLTALNIRPVHVDLGWHRDVVEGTAYKLSVTFTKESNELVKRVNRPSPVQAVGARKIVVQLQVEASTQNLELLLKSLDQFSAVCEASEKGTRPFNGKRFSVYGIGIIVAFTLGAYYLDEESKWYKPSVDVLTLAIGAYTLWMTIGKSALLGETEEDTEYNVTTRENVLLAYHGLAKVQSHVINTCWVPEVHREEHPEPEEGTLLEDGSISLLEAAMYLNVYVHYGHVVKWKGPRLVIDRYKIVEEMDDEEGIGHVVEVQRVDNINSLRYEGESGRLKRLGGHGRLMCGCRKWRSRPVYYYSGGAVRVRNSVHTRCRSATQDVPHSASTEAFTSRESSARG